MEKVEALICREFYNCAFSGIRVMDTIGVYMVCRPKNEFIHTEFVGPFRDFAQRIVQF
jgi:hypothetical protein